MHIHAAADPVKLMLQNMPGVAQVLVELVITRDSGEIETFNAYRVQHDNRCQPVQTSSRLLDEFRTGLLRSACMARSHACK
jgi:glutamate dehydrogenase/leucine dehydrogenase